MFDLRARPCCSNSGHARTINVCPESFSRRVAVGGGRAGFTLVEVLAAVVLLSIGLLAVMAASQAARETQTRALYISIGRGIAQSRIEKLRSVPFDSLAAQAGTAQDPSLPPGNSVVTAVHGYPSAGETNLCRVTVTVSWREKNGTRTIRYETLLVRK